MKDISIGEIQVVIQNLLKEGVAVRDLKTILENKISLTDPSLDITGYTDMGYTIINATHFDGKLSGEFSKEGHHHDGRYS